MHKTVGFYWDAVRESTQEELLLLEQMGTRVVFVPHRAVTQSLLQSVRARNMQIYIDFSLFVGEQWWREFPDSVPVDSSGELLQPEGWYVPVCPNHPDIRRQHIQNIWTVMERFGDLVDGVWLDFIRYPIRWEVEQPRFRQTCFCRHCLQLFLGQEARKYTPEETRQCASTIMSEQMTEWVEWKCSRIAEFVIDVRAIVSQQARPVRLGIFALPWRLADHEGAIRSIAGQDIERLAPHVDVISPMTYHKLCYQPTAWVSEIVQDFSRRSHKPILPVVQSLDLPSALPPEELGDAMETALRAPSEGVMVFPLEPLVSDANKQSAVQKHFS
jgi:hypothetical protein